MRPLFYSVEWTRHSVPGFFEGRNPGKRDRSADPIYVGAKNLDGACQERHAFPEIVGEAAVTVI